jgi:hypothetical protein
MQYPPEICSAGAMPKRTGAIAARVNERSPIHVRTARAECSCRARGQPRWPPRQRSHAPRTPAACSRRQLADQPPRVAPALPHQPLCGATPRVPQQVRGCAITAYPTAQQHQAGETARSPSCSAVSRAHVPRSGGPAVRDQQFKSRPRLPPSAPASTGR